MKARPPRVLIYSHDTYGLGHLRRCRVIAQALVAHRPDISILIVAGSPVVGSFSFPPQVDFIRVPGVVKLGADTYAPSNPGLSLEDLTETMLGTEIVDESDRIVDLREKAMELRDQRLERMRLKRRLVSGDSRSEEPT